MFRNILLWASENTWMKKHIPDMYFTRKAVKRFMPGEELSDALDSAQLFREQGIGTVFTYLGENIASLAEAETVTEHYISAIEEIGKHELITEISLKLTQIGLDYSFDEALQNFFCIARAARQKDSLVWIDMEGSSYTEITLNFFEKVRGKLPNVGLCIQAYLDRTESDLHKIFQRPAHIRLVKGAYRESPAVALSRKSQVDENYLRLAQLLLEKSAESNGRIVFATHDMSLIDQIQNFAEKDNLAKNRFEIHMLYGIRSSDVVRLKEEGYLVRILISCGDAWYTWYIRRLAERPANLLFVLRNIFRR